MNREQMLAVVQSKLPEHRFLHTLGVEETAIALAKKLGQSVEEASTAAILHDIVKYAEKQWLANEIVVRNLEPNLLNYHHELWHSHVGAEIAKDDFQINNDNILNAIRFHTTGRLQMSTLEKIIYVADMIEPNRKFPGVDNLRQLVEENFDDGAIACAKHVIQYLLSQNEAIYPDTLYCYNDFVQKRGNN